MNLKKLLIAVLLLIASTVLFTQTKSFDEEIAPWHKKAIMTCGMLRDMETFDPNKFLQNLDELEAELKMFSDKYLNNPPPEYSKDPLWKTYFEDLMDNTNIIRDRIEKKQYRLAQKYCPYYCMTFGKMHRNNGRTDLTDVLFSWRSEIRTAMDMFSAGNFEGAKNHLEMVDRMYKKVKLYQQKKDDPLFNELFVPLEETIKLWKESIENKDIDNAKINYDKFINEFSKPYMKTL